MMSGGKMNMRTWEHKCECGMVAWESMENRYMRNWYMGRGNIGGYLGEHEKRQHW